MIRPRPGTVPALLVPLLLVTAVALPAAGAVTLASGHPVPAAAGSGPLDDSTEDGGPVSVSDPETTNETTDSAGGSTDPLPDEPTSTGNSTANTTGGTTDVVTNTTGETTDAVTNATNGTADSVTNTADSTTDSVVNTTEGTTGAVTNATEETTDSVTNATNGTTDPVTNATDDPAGITGTTDDTATTIVDATNDTVGSAVDATRTTGAVLVAENASVLDARGSDPADTIPLDGADGSDGADDAGDAATDPTTGGGDPGGSTANRDGSTGSLASGLLSPPGFGGIGATGEVPPPVAGGVAVGGVALLGLLGRRALGGLSASSGVPTTTTRTVTRTTASVLSSGSRGGWRDRLWRLFVAGYRRYDDSDPLEHEGREAIYRRIEDAPGTYLSEISEETGIPLPTVRYHLRILQHENLVTTAKVRGKRRYFPAGVQPSELKAALEDDAPAAVLETLARCGPASVSDLADELDRDASTVSYHVQRLADDGLVERERAGRAVHNRLADEVQRAVEAVRSGDAPISEPRDTAAGD